MTAKLAKFAAKQKAGQPCKVLFFAFNLCHASTGWKSYTPASTESNAAKAESGDAEGGQQVESVFQALI